MNFWNKLTSSSIRVLLPSNHLWSPGPVDVNDDCNCRASPSFSPAAFMASDIPVACPEHQPARPSESTLENVLLFPPMSSSDPSHFPARQDISFHCHTFKTLFMRSKPPSKLQSVRLATWLSPLPCSNPQDQRQVVFRIQLSTKQNQEICAVKSTCVAILDTWTKDFCRVTPGRGDVMTYRSWSPNWMKYHEIPPTATVTFSTSGWTKRHALELISHGDAWTFLPIERSSDHLQHKIWASSTTSHSTRACLAK